MQDEALQAAFEIKTECDEISRRLLRWHWEQKPGSHSLDALLRHIAQRQKESPDYYDRMPDLSGKTSWQQLDTTLCMRVLLDPEKDAAKPLDLLGNTRHPGAARRACNAVRTARNEAAHAADAQDAAQAALLFNEAIESLEEGYADTAFRENELAQYYREAESFLEQCGARKAARPADNTRGQSKAAKPAARTGSRTSGGKASNNSRTAARKRSAPARRSSKKKRTGNRTILTLLLVVLVHCLTGCCAILNPASGHTAIIITAKPSFTVMVPAQWCCAGTATTSCVTRHPNHSSNLLIKTCQHG